MTDDRLTTDPRARNLTYDEAVELKAMAEALGGLNTMPCWMRDAITRALEGK